MIDIEKLKELAEAAVHQHESWIASGGSWPQPNASLLEMQAVANPAAMLELIAELQRIQEENADYKAGQERYEDISEAQRKRISRLEDRLSRRDVWSNPKVIPVKPMLTEPHPLELTMGPGARSGSIQGTRNQCDGCQAGLPTVRGMHRMGAIGRYPDLMACPDCHRPL